ncbi:MAG: diacylglycerol kinase family lipid kinase [Dehalococcoidia bacterium]|nr:diacylglycerol kinase family lipid kinase [Dehalococcoidia bacterium]
MGDRRALFIVNPVAHHFPGWRRLQEAARPLQRAGWRLVWEETQGPHHATALAREAAREGMEVVFACGGDGTLREAACGLVGTPTALAFVPIGTVNVWARQLGIPLRLERAVALALEGQRRLVDVGRADGHYFLLMAGMGLDAQVTRTVNLSLKRWTGAGAYALAALRETLAWRGRHVIMRADGQEVRGCALMLVVGNVRNYAGLVEVTPRARLDDAMLDVCVFLGRGATDTVLHALRVAFRRHLHSPMVVYLQARAVEVEWSEPTPCHVDGDPLDITPVRLEAVPQALWVVLPPGRRTPLLGDSGLGGGGPGDGGHYALGHRV